MFNKTRIISGTLVTMLFVYFIISTNNMATIDKIEMIPILLFMMYIGLVEAEKFENEDYPFHEGYFNMVWKISLFIAIAHTIRLVIERVIL